MPTSEVLIITLGDTVMKMLRIVDPDSVNDKRHRRLVRRCYFVKVSNSTVVSN